MEKVRIGIAGNWNRFVTEYCLLLFDVVTKWRPLDSPSKSFNKNIVNDFLQ